MPSSGAINLSPAPASGNHANVAAASSILTQVETANEGHFAPVNGCGGAIGTTCRLANIAQLSNDPRQASRFRQAFWGSTSGNTARRDNQISDVRRNAAAQATIP